MMQTTLIAILLLVDAGLIYAFWQFSRRRTIEADVVSELADERRQIEDLRTSVRREKPLNRPRSKLQRVVAKSSGR